MLVRSLYRRFRSGSDAGPPASRPKAAALTALSLPLAAVIVIRDRVPPGTSESATPRPSRLAAAVDEVFAGDASAAAALVADQAVPTHVDGLAASIEIDHATVVGVRTNEAGLPVAEVCGLNVSTYVTPEGVTTRRFAGVTEMIVRAPFDGAADAFRRLHAVGAPVSVRLGYVVRSGQRNVELVEVRSDETVLYRATTKR